MHENTKTQKHENTKKLGTWCVFCVFVFSVFLFAWTPAAKAGVNLDASGALGTAARKANYRPTTETTLAETMGNIVTVILSAMGVFFMSLMIYAGFLWMNARGDETQIEKSQSIIRGGVVGLILIMGAYSITRFVVPAVLERTTGRGGGGATVGTPR